MGEGELSRRPGLKYPSDLGKGELTTMFAKDSMSYSLAWTVFVACALSSLGCGHTGLCQTHLQRARHYERVGRYEEAIREAKTVEALQENPREASQIISRSMNAKMTQDIDLAWTLSDEDLKKRGIYVARDCFPREETKENNDEHIVGGDRR